MNSTEGRRLGFTVIELLLAASITALLAGILLAMVVQVLALWSRSGGAMATAGEAARILDQVARDLESVVLRPDPNAWLVATVQRDQLGPGDSGMTGADWFGVVKPGGADSLRLGGSDASLASFRFGQAGVWLRFFTVEPDANDSPNNRSLPRAVAYQLVRRRSGRGHAYQLFRSQVRPGGPNSTFSSGYDLLAPAYTNPNGSEQHPGNIRRPNTRFILGNQVIDFGLRVWVRGAQGDLVQAFPLPAGGEHSFVATTGMAQIPGYATRPVVRGWPLCFEVMVRVLTDEGARALDNLEAGRTPVPAGSSLANHWWSLALAHSQVHVRTILPRAHAP